MSPLRFCLNGGLLVGGEDRLPTDPCEWGTGCNRLRCRGCQAEVRNAPGLKLSGAPDIAKLYSTEDWPSLPFIKQSGGWRLYACKCQVWEASSAKYIENDHDSGGDPDVPWGCEGHEAPTLPLQLGALTVGGDWDRLVARILAGESPRPLGGADDGPVTWLMWLYTYLSGLTAAEDALSSAIAAQIENPDPQAVGRVLYFFKLHPRAAGVERLIAKSEANAGEVAVRHPIPEAIYGPTLWDVLVAFLMRRTESGPLERRAAEVVKKVLLLPLSSLSHRQVGPVTSVELEKAQMIRNGWSAKKLEDDPAFLTYAKDETDVVRKTLGDARSSAAFDEDDLLFIAENAAKIAAVGPGRWEPILNVLLYRYRRNAELGHLLAIAGVALLQGGEVERSELRAWIKKRSYSGDEWVLPLETALEK